MKLRNAGRNEFATAKEYLTWYDETLKWHDEVYGAIKEISIADAEWFYTMDVVPPPRMVLPTQFNQDHEPRFRQHDFQVMRLGEMIREIWGKQ